jgi:hypothetical protein
VSIEPHLSTHLPEGSWLPFLVVYAPSLRRGDLFPSLEGGQGLRCASTNQMSQK